MKVLDFIFAKIVRSYRGRRSATAHASNFVSLLLILTFGPLIGFILLLIPFSSIMPAFSGKTGLKFAIAIIVIPFFLFTYFRYDRAPEGYYDDVLIEYPDADKRIQPWMLYLVPVVLILFWVAMSVVFIR
jgi:hypothetical protein